MTSQGIEITAAAVCEINFSFSIGDRVHEKKRNGHGAGINLSNLEDLIPETFFPVCSVHAHCLERPLRGRRAEDLFDIGC